MKMCVVGILVLMGLAALTGCSNALVIPESQFTQNEQVHCQYVTPTGSHRSRRVCTTRSEREQQSAQAKAELDKALEYQQNRATMERMERRNPSRP
jgi:hypothetical protein